MSDRNDDSRKVTLSDQDLRDAARLLSTLLDSGDDKTPSSPHAVTQRHRQAFVECARRSVRERRRRTLHFGSAMFGEPAWDILLILYIEEDKNRLQVSRLINASGSPATTGLRWLDYLESQQFVCRQKHPTDRRVELVELTDKGRAALDSYFSETVTEGR